MFKLRELEKNDISVINKWRNNPDIISSLGAPFRYINQDVDEKWFDNYMINRGNSVRCAVLFNDNLVGLVSLTSIDTLNRSAEFHIMIGDISSQNKGAGSFATNEMLNHAFNNLNLHRISLSVLEDNTRAQHVYEKVGFKKEGVLRKVFFKNGIYVNAFIYSILKNEYKNSLGGVTTE